MTPSLHLRFWFLILLISVGLIWVLRDVLLPFVAAMGIAYFLDPVVDKIERWGTPRWAATSLVLLSFVMIVGLGLVLIVPLIHHQIAGFLTALPGYIHQFQDQVLPKIQSYIANLPQNDIERVRETAGNFAGTALTWVGTAMTTLLSSSVALFNILSLIFITPVVTFYLLRDWDHMVAHLDRALPRAYIATIHTQLRDIDQTLAGFLRGQATVCLVLGAFYAAALSMAGLPFSVAIGVTAGVLSFIPYVGTITGFVASMGVAFFHYPTYTGVFVVLGIYIVGQILEGNFLTPKLVGERVGLHPVWVMFALMAGGSLFGFLGVLLAVPVAAVLGVLIRFALSHYWGSIFYDDAPAPLPLPPSSEQE